MTRLVPASLTLLATGCFIIGSVAVAIPQWGHFRNRVVLESGHLGPWEICKHVDYGRKMCGRKFVMYKPTFVVLAAGICAAVGVLCIGIFGLLSAFYVSLTFRPTSLNVLKSRTYTLIGMIILSCAAALTSVTSVGLFTTEQGDHPDRGYKVEVGVCFYLEVIAALFCVILMLLTIAEFSFTKREQELFGRLDKCRNGKGGELDLNEDGMNDSNLNCGRHKTRDGEHDTLISNSKPTPNSTSGKLDQANLILHPTWKDKRNNGKASDASDPLNPNSNVKKLPKDSPRSRRKSGGLGMVPSVFARRSPSPSPASSRRGSKCNRYPEPLHFACVGDDDDDNDDDLQGGRQRHWRRSPSPSPSSSRRGSKCNKAPEPLHFACYGLEQEFETFDKSGY